MAFESLTGRLQSIFKKFTGQSRLNEKNMDDMLVEVRKALLDADVNFKVVKDFIFKVRSKALGQKVFNALNPSQMVVKIVNEELQELLGKHTSDVTFKSNGLTVYMFCGLQGSGKTTHVAKLARLLIKKYKKKPLLIGADIYRPAASDQLEVLGSQIGVETFTIKGASALKIAQDGITYAKEHGYDLAIIDTAGRLHIDNELMNELIEIQNDVKPQEVLLVVDAMTGQDAAGVANSFNQKLKLTGVIITKLDSDTRGGAALSVVSITGLPIKLVGVGEKVDDIEIFHPDRMAERILGMGDILSLIEKAQENIDNNEARRVGNRMMSGKFDLNDMLSQFEMINKMGTMGGILKLIPGVPKITKEQQEAAEEQIINYKIIIQSMTLDERKHPEILKAERKIRISKGCGKTVTEVNTLLKNYEKMKDSMKAMSGMMKSGKMPF